MVHKIEEKYLEKYYNEEFKISDADFQYAEEYMVEVMQTTLHFKMWYLRVLGKEIIDNVKKLW